MRIAGAALERYAGELPVPVGNGRVTWERREGLLLRLGDEEEEIGQGEASPLPGYSRESLEEAMHALERVPWEAMPELDLRAPVALEFPRFFAEAGRVLDAVLPPDRLPSARHAAETAILDLAGRSLDLPAHRLLAGEASPHAVALNAWIQPLEWEAARDAIEHALARGISTMKFKVGRAGRFDEELALLLRVRDRFGDAPAIRLDANEAWTLEEAPGRLAALAAVAPEYVEQPVPAALLPDLADPAVPLPADESLRDARARERLLAAPCCAVFVLKPMALGGFVSARELAARASRRGIGIVVSHLLDGPVALAAAMELALSLRPAPLAAGLDLHPGLEAWPESYFPQLARGGLRAASSGGLGVALLPSQRS